VRSCSSRVVASVFVAVSIGSFIAPIASCNALVGNDDVFLWNGDAGGSGATIDAGAGADGAESSVSFDDGSSGMDSADGAPGSDGGTPPLASGTYELLAASGFVLDDPNGGGAQTVPDQWAYEGKNQQWSVMLVSGVTYEILSASGEALTAANTTIAGLSSYTGASDQLWVFWPTGLGSYYVVNVGTGGALDDNGGGGNGVPVQQRTWSSGDNDQYWTLTATSSLSPPIAAGTYEIVAGSGYALDDPGGGGAGTVPDQWAYAGDDQAWSFILVSDATYEILSTSGEALTMTSAANTTLAGLSTYAGSSDQLWAFWPTGLGSYWVVNVGTGMALDDHGGGGIGVQLQQWTWSTGSTHQNWTFAATSSIHAPVADGIYEIAAGSGYALDDPGGGGGGTVPDQSPYVNTEQQWTVTNVSGVQYEIASAGGYALTSAANAGTIGALSTYTGAANQRWVFWANGSSYSIVNVGTNLALDDGTGESASTVDQNAWSAGATQTWTLTAK
jgi:hypothetical protein